MGRKRKRHGGSNPVRKWIKRGLSAVKLVVGGGAAAHGVIRAATDIITGQQGPEQFPRLSIYYYTGVNTDDGSMNQGQLKTSLITIVAGLGTAWLIGQVNKRL